MSQPLTVGAFTYTAEGSISGPAEYMTEQGFAWIARLNDGFKVGHVPAVVEFGYHANRDRGLSKDEALTLAILVGIQTDYAGWKGYRQMFGAA